MATKTESVDFDYLEDGEFVDLTTVRKEDKEASTVKNPFFLDSTGSKLLKMGDKELFTSYKKLYVLCLKDSLIENKVPLKLADSYLPTSASFWNDLAEDLELIEAPMRLLKVNKTRMKATIVDRSYLQWFNKKGFTLDENEVVVMMFHIKSSHVKKYVSLFDGGVTFNDYFNSKILASAFDCEWYEPIKQNLLSMVSSLKESSYWKSKRNCSINMTNSFYSRRMNFNMISNEGNIKATTKTLGQDEGKSVTELIDRLSKGSKHYGGNDYMRFISKKDNHIDASNALQSKNGYKLYYIPLESSVFSYPEIRKNVTNLLESLSNSQEKMLLFAGLASSRDHWGTVFNNKRVLETMKPVFEKYPHVARYVIGYPFLMAYLEECIKKGYSTVGDRHVFDIDTASKLPFFPYVHDIDPHLSPYVPLLVSKSVLQSNLNFLGLRMLKNYKDYGIADLKTFKRNFNLMTTRTENASIFDGLDWKKVGMEVTGSCILSCAMKRSPLLELMKGDSETEKMKSFFTTYFKNDVDIMHYSKSVFDFMDAVRDTHVVVENNVKKHISADGKVQINPIKDIVVHVTSTYLETMEKIEPDFSAEHVIKNITNVDVLADFYARYVIAKTDSNKKLSKGYSREKNALYGHFYDNMKSAKEIDVYVSKTIAEDNDSDHEIYFTYNDIVPESMKVSEDKNIAVMRISENIKFKLSSVHMPYEIEIFRRKFKEPFSTVSRFHLGSVRSYYDGENVYMLPSSVGSLLSFVNIDYKYFAGKRTPLQIFAKYRSRGVGVFLNAQERSTMLEYLHISSEWKEMYEIDPKNKDSVEKVTGSLTLDSNIFKPTKFLTEFNELSDSDLFSNVKELEYVSTLEDYNKVMESKGYKYKGVDWNLFKTINDNGSVTPFSMDLVRLGLQE